MSSREQLQDGVGGDVGARGLAMYSSSVRHGSLSVEQGCSSLDPEERSSGKRSGKEGAT